MAQREILCIDDDAQSLQVRKLLLETFGFRVTASSRAREGLKLFRSRNVDAVVLDYEMPELNGGQLARKMKKARPRVPVVVLSALPWLPNDAPRGCIDAFVAKGGPINSLIHELEHLTEELAPDPAAKAPIRAARKAGAVVGALVAKIRGLSRSRTRKPLMPAGRTSF